MAQEEKIEGPPCLSVVNQYKDEMIATALMYLSCCLHCTVYT